MQRRIEPKMQSRNGRGYTRRRGQLFIDAGIALIIVITGIAIAYSAIAVSLNSINSRTTTELMLLAEIETALSTCFEDGGVAKCNEKYYFYGEIEPRANLQIGNAKANRTICISRNALQNGEIIKLTACG